MAATDILTLAEAKDVLEIADGDNGHDSELSALVTAVSGRIDDLCGPVVQRTVSGEEHDGGCSEVGLRFWPVDAVTSVTEYDGTDSTALTEETNDTKPADGFLLDGEPGRLRWLIRRSSNADVTFPVGRRNVVVTYTAGRYADTASVDEKFKRAASFMVTHLFKSTAPAWHTSPDFLDGGPVSSPVVPGFAVPRLVTEMLADEMRPPSVY